MKDLFTEVVVKKERTAGENFLKNLPVPLAILFMAAGLFVHPVFLLGLLVALLLHYVLSPRLDVEFEYSYVNGELDVAKIFSKQSRKQMASYNMKEMEIFAPLSSAHLDGFRGNPAVRKVDYSSGNPSHKEQVYAFVITADNQKEMILFEPGEKIIQDLRARMPQKVYLQ